MLKAGRTPAYGTSLDVSKPAHQPTHHAKRVTRPAATRHRARPSRLVTSDGSDTNAQTTTHLTDTATKRHVTPHRHRNRLQHRRHSRGACASLATNDSQRAPPRGNPSLAPRSRCRLGPIPFASHSTGTTSMHFNACMLPRGYLFAQMLEAAQQQQPKPGNPAPERPAHISPLYGSGGPSRSPPPLPPSPGNQKPERPAHISPLYGSGNPSRSPPPSHPGNQKPERPAHISPLYGSGSPSHLNPLQTPLVTRKPHVPPSLVLFTAQGVRLNVPCTDVTSTHPAFAHLLSRTTFAHHPRQPTDDASDPYLPAHIRP
jgi:hypothetical protein